MSQKFIFDNNFPQNIATINIEADDPQLASMLVETMITGQMGFDRKEKFFELISSPDDKSFDVSESTSDYIHSLYVNAPNRDEFVRNQSVQATLNPQAFLNWMSVLANKEQYETHVTSRFVKDARLILMNAVKNGANIYDRMKDTLSRQREMNEKFEKNEVPTTVEDWHELQKYTEIGKELANIETHSPYRRLFDVIDRMVDNEALKEEAEGRGDMERVAMIERDIEEQKVALNKGVYGFEPSMLSNVAKSKGDFVRMKNDPALGLTNKEQSELYYLNQLYEMAKKLAKEDKKEKERPNENQFQHNVDLNEPEAEGLVLKKNDED